MYILLYITSYLSTVFGYLILINRIYYSIFYIKYSFITVKSLTLVIVRNKVFYRLLHRLLHRLLYRLSHGLLHRLSRRLSQRLLH